MHEVFEQAINEVDLPTQMRAAADILETVNLRRRSNPLDAHSPAELRSLANRFEEEDKANAERDRMIELMVADMITAGERTSGTIWKREVAELLIDYGWKRDGL